MQPLMATRAYEYQCVSKMHVKKDDISKGKEEFTPSLSEFEEFFWGLCQVERFCTPSNSSRLCETHCGDHNYTYY